MINRLTFLCDNTAASDLECEWGLSVALKLTDGSLWLWDAGQTELFLRNAESLGVDVRSAKGLALSHGHYDHTGGIPALIDAGFQGAIYAHPAAPTPRYNLGRGTPRPIGIPAPLPPFQEVQGSTRIAPGITMVTDIPRRPGLFQAVQGFALDPQGKKPDSVPDDAFLLLETPQGPVVLLGCCHSGLENSLLHLRDQFGLTRLHAVIGGLHLHNADAGQWQAAADILKQFQVDLLAVGHCTGDHAADYLENRLTCRVLRTRSGLTLSFP
ncbi:MAG: MBL fold metallo-hydrolase [Desulfovibrio sp.]|nr:MBL fold metallo-hydrolase [Desulfovibrio sp.]